MPWEFMAATWAGTVKKETNAGIGESPPADSSVTDYAYFPATCDWVAYDGHPIHSSLPVYPWVSAGFSSQVSYYDDESNPGGPNGVPQQGGVTGPNSRNKTHGVYLIFENVDIPQGAFITRAKLYYPFHYSIGADGVATLTIKGTDKDNVEPWPSLPGYSGNISGDDTDNLWIDGSCTTASTTYSCDGGARANIDIMAIVQEIIDRPGWVSGNNIEIIIRGDTGDNNNSSEYTLLSAVLNGGSLARFSASYTTNSSTTASSNATATTHASVGASIYDSYSTEVSQVAAAVTSASVGNVAIEGEPDPPPGDPPLNVIAATALFVSSASVGDVIASWEPVTAEAATASASAISPKLHILSDDSIVSMDHLVHNYQGVTIYQTHEGEIKFATGYGTAAPASIPANSISSMDSVSTPNGDFYAIYQAADGTIKVRK